MSRLDPCGAVDSFLSTVCGVHITTRPRTIPCSTHAGKSQGRYLTFYKHGNLSSGSLGNLSSSSLRMFRLYFAGLWVCALSWRGPPLAASFSVPTTTVRAWEQQKMARLSGLYPGRERQLYMPSGGTRLCAETSSDAGLFREFKLVEFQALLSEVVGVVRETGIRPGIVRTAQAAQSVNALLREFVADPKKYTTDGGALSVPKILRRLFEELGSTYIKLGQFIASSPTLFPPEYVLEFQACLDNSPTIPFALVRSIVQADLGRPISAVYDYVNPVPLASASIAQVHLARLKDGTEVVIKVQKPAADATLKTDLGFLLVAAKVIEFIDPSLSRLSLSNIVGDIRLSMLDELDFRKEAKNMLNFRAFLDRNGIQDAVAPFPYADFSGKKVLTMDYLKGVPLVDLEGIRKFSSNPEQTLITALKTWAQSVVENDIFHADVHGGNLLVLEDGRVGFIDFGIVGKISPQVWASLGDLVQSFVVQDFRGVAKALVGMGAADGKVDLDKFGDQLEAVVSKITALQPEIMIASSPEGFAVNAELFVDERETTKLVLEIVAIADKNGLKLPREFGILLKQALYFDRYQKLLAPSLDPLRDPRVKSALQSGADEEQFVFRRRETATKKFIDVEGIIN